jgi:hypothetical protein
MPGRAFIITELAIPTVLPIASDETGAFFIAQKVGIKRETNRLTVFEIYPPTGMLFFTQRLFCDLPDKRKGDGAMRLAASS